MSSSRRFAWLLPLLWFALLAGALVAFVLYGLPALRAQILEPIRQNQAQLQQLEQQLQALNTQNAQSQNTAVVRAQQLEAAVDAGRDQLLSLQDALTQAQTALASLSAQTQTETNERTQSQVQQQEALFNLQASLTSIEDALRSDLSGLQTQTDSALATLQPGQVALLEQQAALAQQNALLRVQVLSLQARIEYEQENFGNARTHLNEAADLLERLTLGNTSLNESERGWLLSDITFVREQAIGNPANANQRLQLVRTTLENSLAGMLNASALPTLPERTPLPLPSATATVPETPNAPASATPAPPTPFSSPSTVPVTPVATAAKATQTRIVAAPTVRATTTPFPTPTR